MFLEESFIFFPDPYPAGDWRPEGIAPEDAWFTAADGVRLHGWFLDRARPVATILFSHGNAGNLSHRAAKLQILSHALGAAVLAYDYRGYGRSEGRPDEPGVLADARAARTWLAGRAKIDPGEIVLMGESLGAAVSVDLAASEGARGLVLESAFTSVPDVAAFHYPILPARALLRTRLDSLAKIGRYRGPLLQSHGDADTIVPYGQGRRLFEAANGPKQFVTLQGADHNDPPPREFFEALGRFLEGL